MKIYGVFWSLCTLFLFEAFASVDVGCLDEIKSGEDKYFFAYPAQKYPDRVFKADDFIHWVDDKVIEWEKINTDKDPYGFFVDLSNDKSVTSEDVESVLWGFDRIGLSLLGVNLSLSGMDESIKEHAKKYQECYFVFDKEAVDNFSLKDDGIPKLLTSDDSLKILPSEIFNLFQTYSGKKITEEPQSVSSQFEKSIFKDCPKRGMWCDDLLEQSSDLDYAIDRSDADMDSLVARFKDWSISPISRWTHHPCKGETLFIRDGAKIVTRKANKVRRSYPLIDQDLNDFFCSLNSDLYFNGYGGKSNHLFVSLRFAFAQKSSSLKWKKFFLCYDKGQKKYTFQEFSKSGKNLYYVDFRNGVRKQNKEIFFQSQTDAVPKKIKFMFEGPENFVGANDTHSEPRAVQFLLNHLKLIKAALTVPDSHQIKFIQIGLHSFLDFCRDCNDWVAQFQREIRENLFRSLDDGSPLKRRLQEKFSHVLLLVSGQNNRLYSGKEYYFYDDNDKRDVIHQRAGYFLKGYRPFGDALHWDKKTFDENRLIISVREPVTDPADQEEEPSNVTCFVPLKTSALYWGMAAKELYDETEFFIEALNSNLVMVDLSNARLGISEDYDYGDSYSASSGEEFQRIIKALKICKSLQHLDLSENWLLERTVIEKGKNLLSQTFTSFQNLTFLSLEHSLFHGILSGNFLEQVGTAIGTLSNLQNLNLSRNGFNEDTFSYLQKGLCSLNHLRFMDLSSNHLAHGYDLDEDYKGSVEVDTAEALSWIVNYAAGTPTIIGIDLHYNDFDAIDFSWQEIVDEAGLSDESVLSKIIIEDGISPDDFLSDSVSKSFSKKLTLDSTSEPLDLLQKSFCPSPEARVSVPPEDLDFTFAEGLLPSPVLIEYNSSQNNERTGSEMPLINMNIERTRNSTGIYTTVPVSPEASPNPEQDLQTLGEVMDKLSEDGLRQKEVVKILAPQITEEQIRNNTTNVYRSIKAGNRRDSPPRNCLLSYNRFVDSRSSPSSDY